MIQKKRTEEGKPVAVWRDEKANTNTNVVEEELSEKSLGKLRKQ